MKEVFVQVKMSELHHIRAKHLPLSTDLIRVKFTGLNWRWCCLLYVIHDSAGEWLSKSEAANTPGDGVSLVIFSMHTKVN